MATLFEYRNPLVKKAIWALKYHHKRAIGKYFGIALYREFFKQLARIKHPEGDIILIPIPASKKALAKRGYNHAQVICEAIASSALKDGLTLTVRKDILIKSHEVEAQAHEQSKSLREKNVEGIFLVDNGEDLRGKTIILIDDVITTGATIANAKRAIRPWGPKRLLAVAVAH